MDINIEDVIDVLVALSTIALLIYIIRYQMGIFYGRNEDGHEKKL